MDNSTQRTSWACPLACWDTEVPTARRAGHRETRERRSCCPATGPRPPGAPAKAGVPGAACPVGRAGTGLPADQAADCARRRARDLPSLPEAVDAKRQDPRGLRPATSLDALVELFPAPSPAWAPGFQEKLSLASECLFAARREIQRSVRTPISLRDISVLSDLLRKVSDLLAADSVVTALGRPVSGQELADNGYRLLDTAHEYNILAQHFYSDEVQAVRAGRAIRYGGSRDRGRGAQSGLTQARSNEIPEEGRRGAAEQDGTVELGVPQSRAHPRLARCSTGYGPVCWTTVISPMTRTATA